MSVPEPSVCGQSWHRRVADTTATATAATAATAAAASRAIMVDLCIVFFIGRPVLLGGRPALVEWGRRAPDQENLRHYTDVRASEQSANGAASRECRPIAPIVCSSVPRIPSRDHS